MQFGIHQKVRHDYRRTEAKSTEFLKMTRVNFKIALRLYASVHNDERCAKANHMVDSSTV